MVEVLAETTEVKCFYWCLVNAAPNPAEHLFKDKQQILKKEEEEEEEGEGRGEKEFTGSRIEGVGVIVFSPLRQFLGDLVLAEPKHTQS